LESVLAARLTLLDAQLYMSHTPYENCWRGYLLTEMAECPFVGDKALLS